MDNKERAGGTKKKKKTVKQPGGIIFCSSLGERLRVAALKNERWEVGKPKVTQRSRWR